MTKIIYGEDVTDCLPDCLPVQMMDRTSSSVVPISKLLLLLLLLLLLHLSNMISFLATFIQVDAYGYFLRFLTFFIYSPVILGIIEQVGVLHCLGLAVVGEAKWHLFGFWLKNAILRFISTTTTIRHTISIHFQTNGCCCTILQTLCPFDKWGVLVLLF